MHKAKEGDRERVREREGKREQHCVISIIHYLNNLQYQDFVTKQAFQMSWGQNLRLKCEKVYMYIKFVKYQFSYNFTESYKKILQF